MNEKTFLLISNAQHIENERVYINTHDRLVSNHFVRLLSECVCLMEHLRCLLLHFINVCSLFVTLVFLSIHCSD